eukprot:scaffold174029_cov36-Tisochrysis_lutea.AAC.1
MSVYPLLTGGCARTGCVPPPSGRTCSCAAVSCTWKLWPVFLRRSGKRMASAGATPSSLRESAVCAVRTSTGDCARPERHVGHELQLSRCAVPLALRSPLEA